MAKDLKAVITDCASVDFGITDQPGGPLTVNYDMYVPDLVNMTFIATYKSLVNNEYEKKPIQQRQLTASFKSNDVFRIATSHVDFTQRYNLVFQKINCNPPETNGWVNTKVQFVLRNKFIEQCYNTFCDDINDNIQHIKVLLSALLMLKCTASFVIQLKEVEDNLTNFIKLNPTENVLKLSASFVFNQPDEDFTNLEVKMLRSTINRIIHRMDFLFNDNYKIETITNIDTRNQQQGNILLIRIKRNFTYVEPQ